MVEQYGELEELARRTRIRILEMIHSAGSGHPGGSLSSVEILVTLYFKVMDESKGDRFILSKGHAAPLLYAVLMEKGVLPPETDSLRKLSSPLKGHPDALRTPGVEVSSGSLGNGLSVAAGLASALRLDGSGGRVYCLLGDGELDEGLVWEAAMLAGSLGLENLTAVVDRNMLQIDGCTEDLVRLEPLADKWRAFNWRVYQCDGHSFPQLHEALQQAQSDGGPSVLIARTVKGKGVSFMENNVAFHGKAPNDEEFMEAMRELGGWKP